MSEKKTKLSRREFLAHSAKSGLALAAFDTVFASLIASYSRPAFAATPTAFKNFVHINMYGSPPRWMFDLILNPSGQSKDFMANGSIKNVYTAASGRYTNADYKLIKHSASGLYVPYMLGLKVPTSKGLVPAWGFLDNMIQIRGVDALNAAHNGANNLHQAGVAGAPTLSSLTADRASVDAADPTKNAIRSIVINSNPGSIFKSAEGSSQFAFAAGDNGANALTSIFASMRPISTANRFAARFVANNDALADKITDALNSLDPSAKQYYQGVTESSSKAHQILNDKSIAIFSQLDAEWDELYNRYKKLIDEVYATSYPLINDKAIGLAPSNPLEEGWYRYVRTSTTAKNLGADKKLDLRTMFEGSDGNRLAAQFAVTEFLLARGISPSVSLSPGGRRNLMIDGKDTFMVLDQHDTGFMTGIVMNTMYYLAFSSCLLELINTLEAKNLFKDTLIYWSSEFNRSPRTDGSGADHGAPGAHVNLISGRINGFKLIGNIYRNGAGASTNYKKDYEGTWGVGAPVDGKRQQLAIPEVWGSVAVALGMAISDMPNAVDKSALIFNKPGDLTVAAPFNSKAKNIDNGKNKA